MYAPMWKRAGYGADGATEKTRLKRRLVKLWLVPVIAIAYTVATPFAPSQAGDIQGSDLLAPPIGGVEGAGLQELRASGSFYPKAKPAPAATVTPPPPPTPAASPQSDRQASNSPSGRSGSGKATSQGSGGDPNDLGVLLITCYTLTSPTASGEPPDASTAAASKGFLPLGAVISIEGVGTFTIKDRGPLGSKIDIWMASDEDCRAFGKQYRRVKVLSRP